MFDIAQSAPALPAQAWVFDGRATARLASTLNLARGSHTLNPLGVAGTYTTSAKITLAIGATLTVNDHRFAANPATLAGSLTMSDKSWLHAGPVVYAGAMGHGAIVTLLQDTFYTSAGRVTQAGAVSIAGKAYLSSSAGTVLAVSGAITGTGTLNIVRAPGAPNSSVGISHAFGRIRLESAGNTYSGGTVIVQTGASWAGLSDTNQVWAASLGPGNVTLGGTGWGGQAALTALAQNITAATAIINFGTSGHVEYYSSFDLAGFSQAVGGIATMAVNAGTPNCQIISATGTPVLKINTASGQSYTYGGKITNAIALVKNGAGTQVLSGASTYTGGTTINAGTLTLAHAQALGTGPVTVNAGATLNRGGVTIANTVINNGGTVI